MSCKLKPLDGRYFSKKELIERLQLMKIDYKQYMLNNSKGQLIETYNCFVHNPKFNKYIKHLFNEDKEILKGGQKRLIETVKKAKSTYSIKLKEDPLDNLDNDNSNISDLTKIKKMSFPSMKINFDDNKFNLPKMKGSKTSMEFLDELLESNLKKKTSKKFIVKNSNLIPNKSVNVIAREVSSLNDYPTMNFKQAEQSIMNNIQKRFDLINEVNYEFSYEYWIKVVFSLGSLSLLIYFLNQKNISNESLTDILNLTKENLFLIFVGFSVIAATISFLNYVNKLKYKQMANEDFIKLLDLSDENEFPDKDFCLMEDKIINRFSKEKNLSEEAYIKLVYPELKNIINESETFLFEEHNDELYLKLK